MNFLKGHEVGVIVWEVFVHVVLFICSCLFGYVLPKNIILGPVHIVGETTHLEPFGDDGWVDVVPGLLDPLCDKKQIRLLYSATSRKAVIFRHHPSVPLALNTFLKYFIYTNVKLLKLGCQATWNNNQICPLLFQEIFKFIRSVATKGIQ